MENYFDVQGSWAPREEATETLGRRLATYLDRLAAIDPLFGDWARDGFRHRSIVPRKITLPAQAPELRDWIEENPSFKAQGGRKTRVGYSVYARTSDAGEAWAQFWAWLGRGEQGDVHVRCRTGLTILTPKGDPWSLRRIAKPILLALAEAWEVRWAAVSAGNFSEQGHQPGQGIPTYQAGWMVYLGSAQASRIGQPEDIRIESRPNGAVVLIATDEPFSRSNLVHRAAARRIEAALAPLNRSDD